MPTEPAKVVEPTIIEDDPNMNVVTAPRATIKKIPETPQPVKKSSAVSK